MQDPYCCWCRISVVARESGFLKKYKGRGFGKSLSARAGVGMESNLKMSRPSWARPGVAFVLSSK